MKKTLKYIFDINSNLIFNLTPLQFKSEILKSKLHKKLEAELIEETYEYFNKYFKKSLLFKNKKDLRKYAIETIVENSKHKDFF